LTFRILFVLFIFLAEAAMADTIVDPDQIKERTSFQEAGPYSDRIDIKSDVVMVYGIDPGLPDRIKHGRTRDTESML